MCNSDGMEVATRIRMAREQARLTQKQLAKLLKVAQSAISQWESGHTLPDLRTRVLVGSVLKIPLSELLPEAPGVSDILLKDPRVRQLIEHFARLPLALQESVLAHVANLAEVYALSR